jgi:predicted nucleotidyltransferase
MRLSAEQIEAIKQETEHFFGADAQVWLFGSRVDDAAKGGDIDLYVETDAAKVALSTARARGELADRLGRYVDLVVNNHTKDEPIFHIAKAQGVRLA